MKELGRKSWKKLYVCLRRSGLYCSTKGASKVSFKAATASHKAGRVPRKGAQVATSQRVTYSAECAAAELRDPGAEVSLEARW